MNTRHLKNLLFAATVVAASSSLQAATVIPGDPDDGGIGYEWTVKMGGKDQARIEGTVGAWSWDDGGAAAPSGTGWTHTADWIALELERDARLVIRVERRDLETAGSNNLFPAISIYQGWEVAGTETHTFANRGNISWALDIAYLTHFEQAPVAHVIEGTLQLKAGKYSIAVGGNSPGTLAEPNQGFTATLTTKSYYDPADVTIRGQRHRTKKSSFNLKGRIANPESLAAVQVKQGERKLRAKVAGSSWSARVGKLRAGRNVVTVSANSLDGTVSKPKRAVIERIVPKPAKPKAVKAVRSWRGGILVVPDVSGGNSR